MCNLNSKGEIYEQEDTNRGIMDIVVEYKLKNNNLCLDSLTYATMISEAMQSQTHKSKIKCNKFFVDLL